MKKIIFMLSAAALLLTSSCQSDVMEEFKPAAEAQNQAKVAGPAIVVNGILVGKRQDVYVTFSQSTANFYQNGIYMHVKINNVWSFDILPSPWVSPQGVYQITAVLLAPGSYQVCFSSTPLPLVNPNNPTTYTIVIP